ncbi:MAG TPA: enoyl-CoA hydratase/isomerase family protein, partial [Polyangiaceae bacterium]|nr:enoyl-CoA hydratase/isomerase family protein [Polyangiaceae bacterium]
MPESPARDLQIEDHGAVRLIRLVRPAAKNALTLATIEELIAALASAAEAPSVRVVVLSGTRGAFCSGADLRWLTQALESGEPMGPGLERFQALSLGVVELGKPVVAAV